MGCVGSVAAAVGSTLTWSNLTVGLATAPGARYLAAGAYDPTDRSVVVFGGRTTEGHALAETWRFAAGGWSQGPTYGPSPAARWGGGLAYDSALAGIVLFGGANGTAAFGDTWLWNATGWHSLATPIAPSPRAYTAMAFDPALNGVVAFGGATRSGGTLNDTWLLSGTRWINVSTLEGPAPPARAFAGAAYDAQAGAVLVYGGAQSAGDALALGDLWTLDATGWHDRTPSSLSSPTPGPRQGSACVDLPALGGVVLVGGTTSASDGALSPQGTWLYANGAWQDVTAQVGSGPTARTESLLVPDPSSGQAVLFGGLTTAALGDTWMLAGSTLQISVTADPTAGPAPLRAGFSLLAAGGSPPYSVNWSFGDGLSASNETDPSHIYGLPGNYTATVTVSDTAGDQSYRSIPIEVLTAWQGQHQWSNVGNGLPVEPSARSDAQVAYDPGLAAVILFGGRGGAGGALGDTWEFVNNVWINLSSGTTPSPAARWGGSFATDPIDGGLLLFGGTNGGRYFNDTWMFNGTGWQALGAPGPSARAFAQATFDAYDGYLLLFGGTSPGPTGSAGTVDSDTWEYRGGVWENITSQLAIAPPPTTGGAAAFDVPDGQVVLFGGSSVSATGAPGTCYPNGATWVYVGGSWSAVPAAASPTGQVQPAAAYDGTDHLVLLFGGSESRAGSCAVTGDTWSYVGGGWSNLTGPAVGAPVARDGAAMAFDAAEGVVLLFGGNDAGLALNDTWVFPTELNASSTSLTGNGTQILGGSGGSGGTSGGGGSTPPGGGTNAPPPIPFNVGYTLSSTGGGGPLTVTFTASSIGGAAPVTFAWYFGDSSPIVNGSVAVHVYTHPGSYDPVLTATDGHGEVLIRVLATIQVEGGAPPVLTGAPTVASGTPPMLIAEGILGSGAVAVAALALAIRRRELQGEKETEGGDNA